MMNIRVCWRLAFACIVVLLAGCHNMRFVVAQQPAAQVVYQRKHYFLWGLTPTTEVDVRQYCPYGVAAVREQTTFVDGVCRFFTLSIWTPRSSWYYCLPPPMRQQGATP